MPGERWRDVGRAFRRDLQSWLERTFCQRLIYGAREHGDVFKGDPISHLQEEAFDIIFYARVAQQKITELEAENAALRDTVSRLQHCTCACASSRTEG